MKEIQVKKIIILLRKYNQLNTVIVGASISSPYIQNIIEKFYNNEYIVGPQHL